PTKARLIAERYQGVALKKAEADVPRASADWKNGLDEIASTLFAGAAVPPAAVAAAITAAPPKPRSIAPWVVIGASAAAAGVGIFFGLGNESARHEIHDVMHMPDEIEGYKSQLVRDGVIADVLFAAAGAGLVTAVLLWIYD